MRIRLALLLLALAAATQAAAALVDASFGPVVVPGHSTLYQSRLGGYYIAKDGRIDRLRADGQYDSSFSTAAPVAKVLLNYSGTQKPSTVSVDRTLIVVGEDSRGRLILATTEGGGVFYDLDASYNYTIAVLSRLNRDGTLDRSFGQEGFVRLRAADWDGGPCYGNTDFTHVLADGDSLYLAGTQSYVATEGNFDAGYWEVRNLTCALVVKLQDNGALDPSFGDAGWARPEVLKRSNVHGASLEADGSIVLTGMTSFGGGGGIYGPEYVADRKFYRARISPTGATLGTPSLVAGPPIDNSSIDSVGILKAVGTSGWIQLTRYSSRPYEILRLDPEGRPVASFGNGGRVFLDAIAIAAGFSKVGPTAEGGVYALGNRYVSQSVGQAVFCRWLSDGTADLAVGRGGCTELATGRSDIYIDTPNRDGSVFGLMIEYAEDGSAPKNVYRVYRFNASPDVVEFHNTILDHYFYTYDGAEARGIDAGVVGREWVRTGQRFTSGGARPTCRFYSPVASSHFFTVEPAECEAVKQLPIFNYEGTGFYATSASECIVGLSPIHRFFNNNAGSPNHRFVKNLELAPPMAAKGWIQEGVAFCVRP